MITDEHLLKDDHKNRVQQWREQQELQKSGYKAPPQEHLAWVPSGADGTERWMKCLLCGKFSQDDWSHAGCVGDKSPEGSKDHLKNLRNYEWYKDTVKAERLKYHPETAQAAPTKSVAKAAPATASAAPWAKAASAAAPEAPPQSEAPPAPIALPPGWEEAKDEEGNVFYWHPETQKSQWSRPSENTSSLALPPGWEVGEQDGHPYYYNTETNEAQWEPPEA